MRVKTTSIVVKKVEKIQMKYNFIGASVFVKTAILEDILKEIKRKIDYWHLNFNRSISLLFKRT